MMHFLFCFCSIFLGNFVLNCLAQQDTKFELRIVTVATENTDGLKRLNCSSNAFGHKLSVIGMGEPWNGGDMQDQGGAQKIRMLREYLEPYQDEPNLLVLFVDAYDVILNADSDTILRKFFSYFPEKRIVFGAEPFCWPDRTLAPKYPPVVFGERYLNSGMFIGFAHEIYALLDIAKQMELRDSDDDQLFYTRVFLNPDNRTTLGMALDSMSYMFQNLNGMQEFVGIAPQAKNQQDDGATMLENFLYNTNPLILHGNGPSKGQLNVLENYLTRSAFYKNLAAANSADMAPSSHRSVAIAAFVLKPTPYVEEFLGNLSNLAFATKKSVSPPNLTVSTKKTIQIRIYNTQLYNKKCIEKWATELRDGDQFATVEIVNATAEMGGDEHNIRTDAVEWAIEMNADFLFLVDADAHITTPDTLNRLIKTASEDDNYRAILAPLLVRPDTVYSNFWGAVSDSGFYARSFDYLDIVHGSAHAHVWNVPFIGSAVLVSRRKFVPISTAYQWKKNTGGVRADADISMAQFCRQNGHFLFVDSSSNGPQFFGFLVNSDAFAQLPMEARLNLELYDYPNNKKLWESRYIHPAYHSLLTPGTEVPLACPDVYDFPFLSERFCKELIEVMEEFGQWSAGRHQDRRIEGGYENVPTRDIHMNQVGFERHWLQILDEYVAPIQEKVFIGFYQRPIHANMMFVVRYRPDEQASLRPHHDASTYSIDVALNKKDVDYEGGGVRYVRYNCTVPADQIGWSMLFPGRLTHLHEGLPTTRGTRYILVSFINP